MKMKKCVCSECDGTGYERDSEMNLVACSKCNGLGKVCESEDTMGNEELLPCPFCGGKAAVNTRTVSPESDDARLNGQNKFWGVNCIMCGVNNIGLIGCKTEELAISIWNTRTSIKQEFERKKVDRERIKTIVYNSLLELNREFATKDKKMD